VCLPDDLGKQAKDANIPFSQLLRDAVADEMKRRATMAKALTDSKVIKLELIDENGNPYTGRFTGTLIASDDKWYEVYLTDDERVIFYDSKAAEYSIVDDPEKELSDWPDALEALGIKPVVDI
jgi:post-segregation antitoxin (ccd killing protein)